jgi:hypothetical protein
MIKYLIFCLLLVVSSCQMHKTIRREDLLWETNHEDIFSIDFISNENDAIWLNKTRAKKSYLIDI